DDLLVYIAKELVSNPDEVNVKKTERGNTVIFELSVAPEDTGKIIGKNGKRAQAIRSIMKAKYLKSGKRVIVDIVG
ncbi:MAG: KH domain-containing protein, partial [Saccharofermentans sp.]|nr:KH domain-containing protein [Saccharofermentans sp.]